MKTYKIGVVWQMYGYVEVEANSLEEAVKELDWDSDDGIELREGLGRYWPEDDEVEA